MENLPELRKVDGFYFELRDNGGTAKMYMSRGEIMYDNEHDEMPRIQY
jgi:hypothetical protein